MASLSESSAKGFRVFWLDAVCPNAYWRLLVVLCRYAGLRCPSEHFSLRLPNVAKWLGNSNGAC